MNPSTALARVLVDELIRGGVRDVVLSPGSRSAPLAYAVQQAERDGRLRLHVRVDERTGGFLALGLAKGSGSPVVVITTSGTAVANLHPAVLEAHHTGVPLVVLSADRPAELRGTGANQTTVQPGIFGAAVRWSADLPAPESVETVGAFHRSVVCRALAAALDGSASGKPSSTGDGSSASRADAVPTSHSGPVHLNVSFRDPLTPDLVPLTATSGAGGSDPGAGARAGAGARDGDGAGAGAEVAAGSAAGPAGGFPEGFEGRADGRPWVEVSAPLIARSADPSLRSASAERAISGVESRTLVVIGDLSPSSVTSQQVLEWAASQGFPVVAEPLGDHDRGAVVPHGPLLLTDAHWLAEHLPERVVVAGRVTLSRPVASLLRNPGVRVEVHTTAPQWSDPSHVAQAVGPLQQLTGAGPGRAPAAWSQAWVDAGSLVAQAISTAPAEWGSGLALASVLGEALPDGAQLFVGSSNPVRDLDLGLGRRDRALAVVANRGLAGIDGCLSTAVGLALTTDAPSYTWVGDLTFLHDSNALAIGPDEPRPDLTIVVTNDGGGGIFRTLEHGAPERSDDFGRIFGTPTGTDFGALCRAHGIRHVLADSRDAAAEAISRTPSGITVVEVPVDPQTHRIEHARLRSVAHEALAISD